MKIGLGLLALLSICSSLGGHPHAYRFTVSQKNFLLHTHFEIESEQVAPCVVARRAYTVRTSYELYDEEETLIARGICRLFSLGLLYDWGTQIDLYDPDDNYLGLIDGNFGTIAGARFSLYNANKELTAVAFLDESRQSFTVVHPDRQSKTLARLTRQKEGTSYDPWLVKVYDPNLIDPTTIRIFAAFAVERQDGFLE